MLSIRRRLALVILVLAFSASVPLQAQIVISQVYGGGGNTGASLSNDFIEIFNRGSAPVSLLGKSLQYASATGTGSFGGTSAQLTVLPDVTLQPGQYFLVKEASGGAVGSTFVADLTITTNAINMAAGASKVALVNSTTSLGCNGGSTVCDAAHLALILDLVGYGTGASGANFFEGSGPAPTLSSTLAALRNSAGCSDTDSNATDFTAAAPSPRNSTSSLHVCGLGISNDSPLPDAKIGDAYSVTFTAAGGSGTGYSYSFVSGTLPPGVMLSGALLSGTPTANSGSPYSFTIQVTDSLFATAQKTFQLTVNSASTPPTGTGLATPNSFQAPATTLLTVATAPGTNPTSTGITVSGDLTSIGGVASQQFYDDGTHGDLTPNDSNFSFSIDVPSGTASGAKSLPITIADAQARSSSANINLTVQPPDAAVSIKISQVYGGGGNSGATYTNDFIELFNPGKTPVDVHGYSVQYSSATASTWAATPICSGSCVIQPGHYFLVKEAIGAGGTTALPTPDATGTIAMSGTNAKIALVSNETVLAGACPTGGGIVDLVGYGATANCSETSPTPSLSNTTADQRRGNGCIDTDNNSADFLVAGPIPRNSASPAQSCGNDPSLPSGVGSASPSSVDPAANVLLTVTVSPAAAPPSTGITVAGDLTDIGGPAAQPFYDDGTHGDITAGDNTFSFAAAVGAATPTGAHSVVVTISDAQSRTATAPITLSVSSPTCGVERWSVKVGVDPDAPLTDLSNPVRAQVADLGTLVPPTDPPGPPDNARIVPVETTLYVINGTMTLFKKESDVDYHIVVKDAAGKTMVVEIPSPACIITTATPRVLAPSPFAAGIAAARAKFDARFTATTSFTSVSVPVQIKGIGFFDFIHGQTGVAPNGIELHPVVDINFTTPSTTTLVSAPNPSEYAQPFLATATVATGSGPVPTGHVTLYDGPTYVATATLDAAGQASFSTSSLSVGTHSLSVSYEGDENAAESTSTALSHTVNQASQTIDFGALANKTFGDADFSVSATASSGLPVSFSILSGPATIFANLVHITGAGTVTIRASQTGNTNYRPAEVVDQSFEVAKATPVFSGLSSPTIIYGATSTNLAGNIGVGSLVPSGNVSITLNGVLQDAAIESGGSFASSFATGALVPVNPPYTISYSYAGDNNFNSANGVGTLTVGFAITPLFDESKAAQGGSTIPIRVQLSNDSGGNVSSASLVLNAVRILQTSSNATSDVMASGNANPDNNFRFDGTAYIFNLSTKGLATGAYQLQFTVTGDSAVHSVSFQVR